MAPFFLRENSRACWNKSESPRAKPQKPSPKSQAPLKLALFPSNLSPCRRPAVAGNLSRWKHHWKL